MQLSATDGKYCPACGSVLDADGRCQNRFCPYYDQIVSGMIKGIPVLYSAIKKLTATKKAPCNKRILSRPLLRVKKQKKGHKTLTSASIASCKGSNIGYMCPACKHLVTDAVLCKCATGIASTVFVQCCCGQWATYPCK